MINTRTIGYHSLIGPRVFGLGDVDSVGEENEFYKILK